MAEHFTTGHIHLLDTSCYTSSYRTQFYTSSYRTQFYYWTHPVTGHILRASSCPVGLATEMKK